MLTKNFVCTTNIGFAIRLWSLWRYTLYFYFYEVWDLSLAYTVWNLNLYQKNINIENQKYKDTNMKIKDYVSKY